VDGFNGYASMRNSPDGYWNQFNLILDYTNLDAYIDSIQHYVTTGEIASVGECYIPIRLKPHGDNSLKKLRDGIDHIELRMFDLNPLDSVGIKVEDLKFVHYLMIYLLSLPSIELPPSEQVHAMENHKRASAFSLESVEIYIDGKRVPLVTKALSIVDGMLEYYKTSNVGVDFSVIEFQRQKLLHPERRYSNQVYETFRGSFVKNGLKHIKV
jgi:glutamate--cysteine ligase